MCGLGEKVPRENERTNTSRDQEGQNSNKVEGSGNVNQRLGNRRRWQRNKRKERTCVSGAASWVDHRHCHFCGLKKEKSNIGNMT